MPNALAHTIELHRLMRAGLSHAESYEAICESLDKLYPHLSSDERSRLRLMSGDLYVTEPIEKYLLPATGPTSTLVNDLGQASSENRWSDVLTLLRQDLGLARANVAFLRANAYLQSNVPLLAFELARDRISDGPYDEANALVGLESSSVLPVNHASIEFVLKLLRRTDLGLFVTASALFLLLRQSNAFSPESRESFLIFAPPRLQLALNQTKASSNREELSFAFLVLGLLHETLGKDEGAIDNYRLAFDTLPTSLEALQMLAGFGEERGDETVEVSFDTNVRTFKAGVDRRLNETSQRLLASV